MGQLGHLPSWFERDIIETNGTFSDETDKQWAEIRPTLSKSSTSTFIAETKGSMSLMELVK